MQQRVKQGHVVVRHVRDVDNPADFLTKWLSEPKFKASLEYAINASEAVDATSEALTKWAAETFQKAYDTAMAEMTRKA